MNENDAPVYGVPGRRYSLVTYRVPVTSCACATVTLHQAETAERTTRMGTTEHGSHQGAEAIVDVAVSVGQRPDGSHCVTLQLTTGGISTYGIAFPPDVARSLAPQLAKELTDASQAAQDADRKAGNAGLTVVAGLPDSLRKG